MTATHRAWNVGERAIALNHARVMGVVNLTPDSFFDGGKFVAPGADAANVSVVVRRCGTMLEQGADLLDFGGESTRPGATPVAAADEIRRVCPSLAAVAREHPDAVLSVDTRHAEVAAAAMDAGANVVNDISCLGDPAMAGLVAERGAGLVISHLRGSPQGMQERIAFDDLFAEVAAELADAVARAKAAGVRRDRILVDPGVGFGKTAEQSAALVVSAQALEDATGCPVLIGASRKSFLQTLTTREVDARLNGSVAAAVAAVAAGAAIVRVHDVGETVDALRVYEGVFRARERVGGGRPASGASPDSAGSVPSA